MTDPTKLKDQLGEEEWENFEPHDALSPDISGKLWDNINKNTASSARHYSYLWLAMAASVLLVIVLSWQFLLKKQKTGNAGPAAVALTKHISNTTPRQKAITLSDGSTIQLLPSATLSFPESFSSLQRDVVLNGEASFDIARDAAKPFSVYCNSLLITVLGTRFTVNSFDSNTLTKVVLQEGKVKVRISDSSSPDKNEYYLSPGDVFIYKKSLSARVLHLEKDKDESYVFNNYPLDVVFDQLQIIYNAKIIYDKAALGNRTFIGKIDRKDPLYPTLQSIVLLNNFTLHKQGDSYLITAGRY